MTPPDARDRLAALLHKYGCIDGNGEAIVHGVSEARWCSGTADLLCRDPRTLLAAALATDEGKELARLIDVVGLYEVSQDAETYGQLRLRTPTELVSAIAAALEAKP